MRAHQERKKYKELIRSVGVLEKVMLRWYRKGVGLRGFNSGAMPVDEEVEAVFFRGAERTCPIVMHVAMKKSAFCS